MKRRNFLKGCLAVTALAIVPVPHLHAYPVLWGDGIHDDTEALQALLDLKPYVCEGDLIEGQTRAIIENGLFKVSGTLYLSEGVIIRNCTFEGATAGDPLLYFRAGAYNAGDISIVAIKQGKE